MTPIHPLNYHYDEINRQNLNDPKFAYANMTAIIKLIWGNFMDISRLSFLTSETATDNKEDQQYTNGNNATDFKAMAIKLIKH